MISPDKQEQRKRKAELINRLFFYFDSSLSLISLLLSFAFIPDGCSMSFFLYFTIFYIGQSIQHYLLFTMPKIDIIKYDLVIKRCLKMISGIEITYFFFTFMFWTRADIHPFYCFICTKIGFPLFIGVLFTIHFIATLLIFIQFLHGYISRKYYLLALGGFQVERRLIQQREENQRRVGMLEPYYNDYPIFNDEIDNKSNKFYKFSDIKQDVEGEEVCSICLTREKPGFHPILTPCNHYFHRQCIEDWAKINSKCPECRTEFKQIVFQQLMRVQPQPLE